MPSLLPFSVDDLARRPWTLWRYREAFPAPLVVDVEWEQRVTLGEGGTPLVPLDPAGPGPWLKLDQHNPTGSFKDRGAAVLIASALAAGVERVVVDSSGNAGAAAAAYCARAGLRCDVYVPAAASPGKLAQIAAYGAEVHPVDGPRAAAAEAALAAVDASGAFHASHVHQPAFHAGVATLAYELWEQAVLLADGPPPARLVVPVGNGSLLLGLSEGFARLAEAGLIAQIPRLVGVQAQACAPIATAWSADPTAGGTVAKGADSAAGVRAAEGAAHATPTALGVTRTAASTVAEGVAVADPPRLGDVVAAVRTSGGEMVTVSDDEIMAAGAELAGRGLWVEPSGAVAFAGWRSRLQPTASGSPWDDTVIVLTGHGLKAPTLPVSP